MSGTETIDLLEFRYQVPVGFNPDGTPKLYIFTHSEYLKSIHWREEGAEELEKEKSLGVSTQKEIDIENWIRAVMPLGLLIDLTYESCGHAFSYISF